MIPKETQSKLEDYRKYYYSSIMAETQVAYLLSSEIIRELTSHIEKLEKQLGVATDTLKYIAMVDMEMYSSSEFLLDQRLFDISESKKALCEIEEMK